MLHAGYRDHGSLAASPSGAANPAVRLPPYYPFRRPDRSVPYDGLIILPHPIFTKKGAASPATKGSARCAF